MAATQEQSEQRDDGGRNVGRIEEIQGVVIEAVFPDQLPEINTALVIEREDNPEEQEGISAGTGKSGQSWPCAVSMYARQIGPEVGPP